tara:strand:- start:411 stop:1880 length:1470 start_codon:yes stop_codon:yes gene_type:complete
MFSTRDLIRVIVLILVPGLLYSLEAQQSYRGDIILEPLKQKQGETQIMIFVPHPEIGPEGYIDLLKRIQYQADFPLWIANLNYRNKSSSVRNLGSKIQKIRRYVSKIEQQEILDDRIWVSGHSRGASAARRIANQYAGLILFSSFFQRSLRSHNDDYESFEKPLLIISGELDGITRPSYIARDYEPKALTNEMIYWHKLILLVEGVNHSLFALKDSMMNGDLPAAIEVDIGRNRIARATAAFLNYHKGSSFDSRSEENLNVLREYDDFSSPILDSFFELNQMDNSVCEIVQDEILANGMGSGTPYQIKVTEITKSSSFSMLEPTVNMSYNGDAMVHAYKYKVMPNDSRNSSSRSPAPKKILCKMKSAKAVADAHWADARFIDNSCSRMQLKFMETAFSKLNDQQLSRYRNSGNRIGIGAEKKYKSNFLWLSNRDPLVIGSNGRYEIQNQTLYKEIGEFIGDGGVNYCKFITPSRLLDWYLTDGLYQNNY